MAIWKPVYGERVVLMLTRTTVGISDAIMPACVCAHTHGLACLVDTKPVCVNGVFLNGV